MSAVHY